MLAVDNLGFTQGDSRRHSKRSGQQCHAVCLQFRQMLSNELQQSDNTAADKGTAAFITQTFLGNPKALVQNWKKIDADLARLRRYCLPRERKRGLCCRPVSVCPSVRPSVTFV